MTNSLALNIETLNTPNGNSGSDDRNESLFYKRKLGNGMEVFDFNEDAIIDKLERMMQILDETL